MPLILAPPNPPISLNVAFAVLVQVSIWTPLTNNVHNLDTSLLTVTASHVLNGWFAKNLSVGLKSCQYHILIEDKINMNLPIY